MGPLLPYDSAPTLGVPSCPQPSDMRPGQFNDYYQRIQAMPYGRALRGLGAVPASPYHADTWAGGDPAVDAANEADDSVGNGIFDGPGAPAVQHGGTGIFQARYAEPGWLYRERLAGRPSAIDARTGGAVQFRPGGGGWPDDMAESYRPYDREVPRYYARKALGEDEPGPAGIGTWAFAGLIIGVAAALVVGTLKAKE
jgi:hypothetical protein